MKRVLVLLLAIACGGEKPIPVATGPLPEGIVARVGGIEISGDLVRRVAQSQKTSPRAAAESLADDALAARAALDRGLDRDPDVAWRLRALRARFVTDRIRDEVKAKGLPTDAEVAELTQLHWTELDSPEQRKVIHAIVLKPAASGEAVPVADALRRAVEGATDDVDFETRATNVPHGNLQTKVERLPRFVVDGRVAMPGAQGGLDTIFTAAAFAIPKVGDTSPVIETSFGWHVIRLVEIVPPYAVPLEQRRTLLAAEVNTRRGREKHDALLESLKKTAGVDIRSSAEQSMKTVKLQ